MSLSVMRRDVSKYRFALPNDIWARKLRPSAFAMLAYFQYQYCRKFGGAVMEQELVERTHMSAETAQNCVEQLIRGGLLTERLTPDLPGMNGKKYFTMPDKVFHLGLGHGAITVYAYLLCCEDRRTHQCHPSYSTVSGATGLAVNTVMKHVTKLTDKRLIIVERTSYIDNRGMKWNGNNCYTILPIRAAVEAFHRKQLEKLEEAVEQEQITGFLAEQVRPAKAPCAPS